MISPAQPRPDKAHPRLIRIAARLEEVARVRGFVADICGAAGMSEERTFDAQVAVSEAAANAIEHAASEVEVTAWLLPDRILVEVENRGSFHPGGERDSTRRRGLGFPLMVSLADQVHVARLAGDLTRVSLSFLLATSAADLSLPDTETRRSIPSLNAPLAPRPPLWVLALVPLFALAVAVLATLHLPHARYLTGLSVTMAVLFITFPSLVIAALAARSYMTARSDTALFIGCGSLALGWGALLASIDASNGAWNAHAATYHAAALVAGLCHLTAALFTRTSWSPRQRSYPQTLVVSYLVILVLLGALVVLIYRGDWPTHFLQWTGHTLFGLSVARASAGLFAVAAIVIFIAPGISRDGFRQWYAAGLALLGTGSVATSAQLAVGDPLYWLGMTAVSVGSLVIFAGLIRAAGRTGSWLIPLERALQESQERYRLLVDQSPDAILVDVDGRYVFANPAAADIFGARSAADLLGRAVLERAHPDDRDFVKERMRLVLGGAPGPPRELTMLRLDGTAFTAEVTRSRVHFDGRIGTQVVMHDVSERRQAEVALRESEFFYRQTLESIPGMVFTTRPDGYCDYQGRQWADYTGVPISKHLGNGWRELLHPDDRPRAYSAWRRAVEEAAPYDLEYRVRRSDGEYEWFKVVGRPIHDAGGRIVRWLGVALKIEDLKRAEEQQRRSEEEYRRLAAENERLYQEQRKIAEDLQEGFLHVPSQIGRVRVGHIYRSATKEAWVGGDFYDVFAVKDGKIAVLIGDVSGHGIKAARTAALVKDVVRAFIYQSHQTEDVMLRANQLLVERGTAGFVTLFLAVLDLKSGALSYTSAGHPPVILRRRHDGLAILSSGSPPLGAFPDTTWRSNEINLNPQDVLLLYTDGVTEERRGDDFFGEDRLHALVEGKRICVEQLPQLVLDEVLAFSGGALHDDVAILALSLMPDGAPPAGTSPTNAGTPVSRSCSTE